jgi:translation elongation factor EF-G
VAGSAGRGRLCVCTGARSRRTPCGIARVVVRIQRHGQIQNVTTRAGKRIVEAAVGLRNMFGYSTRLRSLSEGRATFSMQFRAYDVLG